MDSQDAIVDEIQKAQEEYLSALSHETAIDKRYLKSLIEENFPFRKENFFLYLYVWQQKVAHTHMSSGYYIFYRKTFGWRLRMFTEKRLPFEVGKQDNFMIS